MAFGYWGMLTDLIVTGYGPVFISERISEPGVAGWGGM
jgi:hypothetical protein